MISISSGGEMVKSSQLLPFSRYQSLQPSNGKRPRGETKAKPVKYEYAACDVIISQQNRRNPVKLRKCLCTPYIVQSNKGLFIGRLRMKIGWFFTMLVTNQRNHFLNLGVIVMTMKCFLNENKM